MKQLIARLREEITAKQAELAALNNSLEVLLRSNRETCKHPNMVRTPYEHDCPDCGYYKERSF